MARKNLLRGGIGLLFCKPVKLRASRDGSKARWVESGMDYRERDKAIRRYVAPVTVVSGSMMLPVSQAPSICTGGASSCHHKKFENSLSTEEEDLVPAMGSS
ncbi:hypothetical protein F2Q69_00038243 [Brassica cretica]|uniref:Uncharacterized protein n=1 Tax=Brassica cretica TaxID=69181 RepID=A0A8S9ST92_BRACR|nr:hypothetical protein F2Q69_00038243 [Brassica cretica]